MSAQRSMLKGNAKAQSEPIKARVDPSIELALTGFIFATLFVALTVWPFGNRAFWVVFWALMILIPIVIAILYVQGRRTRSRVQRMKDQINTNREEYQEWHNEHVFREKRELCNASRLRPRQQSGPDCIFAH